MATNLEEADNTPANDCMKLLDNGRFIVLFQNGLGSYTAVALGNDDARKVQRIIDKIPGRGRHITEDCTPAKALYRLTEKAITGRVV